jgi:hypothetical protein
MIPHNIGSIHDKKKVIFANTDSTTKHGIDFEP